VGVNWIRTGLGVACILTVTATGCSRILGDPVRDQWGDRASLASCGEVVLEQGERLQHEVRSEFECLRAAFHSGSGAELKVQAPTTEGDPVTSYYRVTPAGTTEVYVDSTHDKFGDQKWSFADCKQPESVLDVNC
jgi:hypothetical protein